MRSIVRHCLVCAFLVTLASCASDRSKLSQNTSCEALGEIAAKAARETEKERERIYGHAAIKAAELAPDTRVYSWSAVTSSNRRGRRLTVVVAADGKAKLFGVDFAPVTLTAEEVRPLHDEVTKTGFPQLQSYRITDAVLCADWGIETVRLSIDGKTAEAVAEGCEQRLDPTLYRLRDALQHIAQPYGGAYSLGPAIPIALLDADCSAPKESAMISDENVDPTIQDTIAQMRTAAGRYADHKMVLFMMGSSESNEALLYIEEWPGRVRVVNPQIEIDYADHALDDLISHLFKAHGITGQYGPDIIPPRFDGQIRLLVEGDQFSIRIVYPDELPQNLSPYQRDPKATAEQRIAYDDNYKIRLGELYFEKDQLIYVNTGERNNMPPKRFDLRTKASVDWPPGEPPPPTKPENEKPVTAPLFAPDKDGR